MTRPAQPQPYPGDAGAYQPAPAAPALDLLVPLVKEYRDALGRPLSGVALISPSSGPAVEVAVTEGRLNVRLARGTYRVVATLMTPEGRHSYDTATVTL